MSDIFIKCKKYALAWNIYATCNEFPSFVFRDTVKNRTPLFLHLCELRRTRTPREIWSPCLPPAITCRAAQSTTLSAVVCSVAHELIANQPTATLHSAITIFENNIQSSFHTVHSTWHGYPREVMWTVRTKRWHTVCAQGATDSIWTSHRFHARIALALQ